MYQNHQNTNWRSPRWSLPQFRFQTKLKGYIKEKQAYRLTNWGIWCLICSMLVTTNRLQKKLGWCNLFGVTFCVHQTLNQNRLKQRDVERYLITRCWLPTNQCPAHLSREKYKCKASMFSPAYNPNSKEISNSHPFFICACCKSSVPQS